MTFNEKMTAIANEVRTLSGATDALNLDEIASHTKNANNEVVVQESLIRQIQNALEGKGSVGGTTPANPVLEPLFVTENGTYTPAEGVDGFTPVIVDVEKTIPEGYIKPSGKKTISQNGTDIDVAEFAKVDVSVPIPKTVIEPLSIIKNGTYTAPDGVNGYSPIEVAVPVPDGYIKPSGTKSITANGTHDAREYESVAVNVPIPNGYIKPSGKKTISENGENINVSEYATVDVNVPIPSGYIKPSGTLEITENGSYDITQLERVEVNIESGGGGDVDGLIDGSITEITSEVTDIRSYAFSYCAKLVSANFPNATSMGASALRNCSSLESASIPNVREIKAEAFSYCSSLKNIEATNARYIYDSAFRNCTALENVVFPSVTQVSTNVFYGCTMLYKVDFPEVSTLTGYAFQNCTKLEALILRRTDKVCSLSAKLTISPYIYVPRALKSQYSSATNWSFSADRIRAIEDYPEICGG